MSSVLSIIKTSPISLTVDGNKCCKNAEIKCLGDVVAVVKNIIAQAVIK